jgi:hypothetical protein
MKKISILITLMFLIFASVTYAGTVIRFQNDTVVFNYTTEDLRDLFPGVDVGEYQYQVLGPTPNGCAYMTIILHGKAVLEGYLCQGMSTCIWGSPIPDGTLTYSWSAAEVDGVHHAHLTICTDGNWYGILIDSWGNAVQWYHSMGGNNWTSGPVVYGW